MGKELTLKNEQNNNRKKHRELLIPRMFALAGILYVMSDLYLTH
jgi:hypothetical protein